MKHVVAPKLLSNWFMLSAVRISSYGCNWEVWRALKKLKLLFKLPACIRSLIYAG